MKKVADKYANICGYRQHGLKYDDLIVEENETVQTVSPKLADTGRAGQKQGENGQSEDATVLHSMRTRWGDAAKAVPGNCG